VLCQSGKFQQAFCSGEDSEVGLADPAWKRYLVETLWAVNWSVVCAVCSFWWICLYQREMNESLCTLRKLFCLEYVKLRGFVTGSH
jgi:hypothetical protein